MGKSQLKGVIHDKQSLMLCGLHALRAMLQENIPKDAVFNKAKQLEKDPETKVFGPHYTSIIGNFSYDVLAPFLKDFADKNSLSVDYYHPEEEQSDYSDIKGILVNVKSTFGRHWFTVRRLGDLTENKKQFPFYNLDSKLSEPKLIGEEEIFPFLKQLRDEKEAVFYILKNKQ